LLAHELVRKSVATFRHHAVENWCPGEDSNLHASRR
jgi:hypothetical protein